MTWKQFIFLIQSISLMLLLGTVYAWSVLRVEVESVLSINATLSGLPYMLSLICYALAMMVAGKAMLKYRRLIVLIGMTSFVGGWFLSSLATNIWVLTLTYGVLMGAGVGLLYGVPLFMLQQTFPKHIGFFSGLILMGFGLSSSFMTPLLTWLLTSQTLYETFNIIGMIAVIVLALTVAPLLLPLPQLAKVKTDKKPYDKHAFSLLYLLFILSLISGLMIIGLTYRIGVINYQFDVLFVTISMSIFSIINGLTRPFFGWLVDRYGFYKIATFALFILLASGLLSLLNGGSHPLFFAISFGAFWFGLGNWMALAPLAIKIIFPPTRFSELYGKLFTAYGIAAVIGTLFSGAILDLMQSTWPIYALIIAVNFINIFVILQLKKRHQSELVLSGQFS
jgi:MFS transporter, OFA family, oxalate/formate antiporter